MSSETAPWGEERHYAEAAQANARADVNPPRTKQQIEREKARQARVLRRKRDLRNMALAGGETFEELLLSTIPMPTQAGMLSPPAMPVSMEFFMGYRAGQHSVLKAMRDAADSLVAGHRPTGDDDG